MGVHEGQDCRARIWGICGARWDQRETDSGSAFVSLSVANELSKVIPNVTNYHQAHDTCGGGCRFYIPET
jgi:hypothetical protein